MKKRVKKNDKAKPLLKGAEEISFSEKDAAAEDLSQACAVKECVA